MEQKTNAVDTDAACTAEAEKKENATSDRSTIGKFTSVDALYRAYERLEAEFTRRSQRLKALEAGISAGYGKTTPDGALSGGGKGENPITAECGAADTVEAKASSPTETENKPDGVFPPVTDVRDGEIPPRYSPANFCKGSAVIAPPMRPRTLAEAGELAKLYIKYKGES